jgi:hypothetical protein
MVNLTASSIFAFVANRPHFGLSGGVWRCLHLPNMAIMYLVAP